MLSVAEAVQAPVSLVTVCGAVSFCVQVTVVPGAIVIICGLKAKFWIATCTVARAGATGAAAWVLL